MSKARIIKNVFNIIFCYISILTPFPIFIIAPSNTKCCILLIKSLTYIFVVSRLYLLLLYLWMRLRFLNFRLVQMRVRLDNMDHGQQPQPLDCYMSYLIPQWMSMQMRDFQNLFRMMMYLNLSLIHI